MTKRLIYVFIGLLAGVLIASLIIWATSNETPAVVEDTTIDLVATEIVSVDAPNVEEEVVTLAEAIGEKVTVTDFASDQPTVAMGEYSANTAQLKAWAYNNMHEVTLGDVSALTISLAKNLETINHNIVLYIETDGRYCGGRIVKDYMGSSYTFDLNDMAVVPAVCWGDWASKISGKTVKIGGYVSMYNGNKITAITFN